MKLSEIKNGNLSAEWAEKGYELPKFDIEAVKAKTHAEPTWVHFGAGNIFRAFPAAILNDALPRDRAFVPHRLRRGPAAGRAAAPVHRPDRGNGSADVYSHHCTPQLSAGSGIDDAVHLCGVLCHAAACAAYQHGGKHESAGVSLQNLHKKNMVSQKFFGMIMLPTGGAATA